MESITIETKTNGYSAEGIQSMIKKFEKVAARLFPGCTVRHFYYGEHLDMADIICQNGDYGNFNITAKRVSFNGHCGDYETIRKFESMTYNDELFDGKLLELANMEESTMKAYQVIGGQYEQKWYGESDTLRGARVIAGKHKEYWDNHQGWQTPKVYRAEDCMEIEARGMITVEDGTMLTVHAQDALPV